MTRIGGTITNGGRYTSNHFRVGEEAMFLTPNRHSNGTVEATAQIGHGPHHHLVRTQIACIHAIIVGKKHRMSIVNDAQPWKQLKPNQQSVSVSVRQKESNAEIKSIALAHHHFSAKFGQNERLNRTCVAMRHSLHILMINSMSLVLLAKNSMIETLKSLQHNLYCRKFY